MPGREQGYGLAQILRRGDVAIPAERFIALGPRGKIACRECGTTGYGNDDPRSVDDLSPWMVLHCFEHRYGCHCGARMTSPGAVATHIAAMQRRGEKDHAWM